MWTNEQETEAIRQKQLRVEQSRTKNKRDPWKKNRKQLKRCVNLFAQDRTKGKCQMSLGFVVASSEKYRKVSTNPKENISKRIQQPTSVAVCCVSKVEMRKVFGSTDRWHLFYICSNFSRGLKFSLVIKARICRWGGGHRNRPPKICLFSCRGIKNIIREAGKKQQPKLM